LLGFNYVMAQREKSILIAQKKGIKIKVIPEDDIKEKYYVVDNCGEKQKH